VDPEIAFEEKTEKKSKKSKKKKSVSFLPLRVEEPPL
jgi:hypothetical protein